eukprot:363316-Chlamydomonas_euryale.AAC.10
MKKRAGFALLSTGRRSVYGISVPARVSQRACARAFNSVRGRSPLMGQDLRQKEVRPISEPMRGRAARQARLKGLERAS